jgi:hypothetical protein
MAQYRDVLPALKGWIHELAQGEINPDAEKVFEIGRSFDPQRLIEQATTDFLAEMRECMTEYARTLNAYSDSSARFQEVKIYSIAQTAADFLLFRNQVKMVIANTAPGVIQISFSTHVHSTITVDGTAGPNTPGLDQPQELVANVGPFRDIHWTFKGEKVEPEQVARFYFIEFVRASRDQRKSRSNPQVLLEQIKTFLEEKGFQLK